MNVFTLPLLLGGAEGAAEGGGAFGGGFMSFMPFVLIIAIFYFLIIRPQNRKQKETQRMLGNLKKGDKVVTIGGVYGVIQSVKEKSVIIKVDDDVKLEFLRSAVANVLDPAKIEEEPAGKDKDKTENKIEAKSGGAPREDKKDDKESKDKKPII